jgi:hypothetical protein
VAGLVSQMTRSKGQKVGPVPPPTTVLYCSARDRSPGLRRRRAARSSSERAVALAAADVRACLACASEVLQAEQVYPVETARNLWPKRTCPGRLSPLESMVLKSPGSPTGLIVRLIAISERDGFVCLIDCDQLAGQVWGWEAAKSSGRSPRPQLYYTVAPESVLLVFAGVAPHDRAANGPSPWRPRTSAPAWLAPAKCFRLSRFIRLRPHEISGRRELALASRLRSPRAWF